MTGDTTNKKRTPVVRKTVKKPNGITEILDYAENNEMALVKKTRFQNGVLQEIEEIDIFGSSKKAIYDKDQQVISVIEKEVDASGAIRQTVYDRYRQIVSITEVDKDHQLKRITYPSHPGQRRRVYTFAYDEYGYLVKQKASFGAPLMESVEEWWRKPIRKTAFSKRTGCATFFEEGFEPDFNEYEGTTRGVFNKGKISKVVACDFMNHMREIKYYQKGQLVQENLYELGQKSMIQRRYDTRRSGRFIMRTMVERLFRDREKDACERTVVVETKLDLLYRPQLTHIYTNGVLTRSVMYSLGNQKDGGEKMESDYNAQGQCVEERFLTMSNKLLSTVRYEYNASGRCVDSYKWNGKAWISEETPQKKAPVELSQPPLEKSTSRAKELQNVANGKTRA